ncbi:MAG: PfkB family carbohydrate kinase [Aquificota bacterium]|nr:PfkB family carbohydrate kinase [Aquificota bacterium]
MMDKRRVLQLLSQLQNLRILVVGDVILDRYLHGKVERISPEAPVPIVEVEREELRLGGAANVAANLVSLGAKASLTGVVGKDRSGEQIAELLKEKGMENLLVEEEGRPTTEKTRIVSMSQQLLRVDQKTEKVGSQSRTKLMRAYILEGEYDGIVVSDYAKGVITHRVMETIRDRELFYAIDPRPANKSLYAGASLMTPNEKELRAMTDPLSEDSVETLGKVLKKELELRNTHRDERTKGHDPLRGRGCDLSGKGEGGLRCYGCRGYCYSLPDSLQTRGS